VVVIDFVRGPHLISFWNWRQFLHLEPVRFAGL
jgi:hypothetical protein